MARRTATVRQARRNKPDDDTLLIRSAESLGRVIGSLRRQLLGASAPAPTDPAPKSTQRRRTISARANGKTTKKANGKMAKKTTASRKTKQR